VRAEHLSGGGTGVAGADDRYFLAHGGSVPFEPLRVGCCRGGGG
jgi:hypothetical protein